MHVCMCACMYDTRGAIPALAQIGVSSKMGSSMYAPEHASVYFTSKHCVVLQSPGRGRGKQGYQLSKHNDHAELVRVWGQNLKYVFRNVFSKQCFQNQISAQIYRILGSQDHKIEKSAGLAKIYLAGRS